MQTVPLESRSQNRTGSERCGYCLDEGQVVVLLRALGPAVELVNGVIRRKKRRGPEPPGYEEMAPCPYCEHGYHVEFPQPNAKNAKPGPGPWGKHGFWADAASELAHGIEKLQSAGYGPLPVHENRSRLQKLAEQIGRTVETSELAAMPDPVAEALASGGSPAEPEHHLEIVSDFMGDSYHAYCSCGWRSGAQPTEADAALAALAAEGHRAPKR